MLMLRISYFNTVLQLALLNYKSVPQISKTCNNCYKVDLFMPHLNPSRANI